MDPQIVGLEDAGSIAEYDALFIRAPTRVDHPTYRMARRAASAGLFVIDDPISILRCTNKVFQAELFRRHGIPHPATVVCDDDRPEPVADAVGLPCVLKRPDSAFSQGVSRAKSLDELRTGLADLLRDSELVVAQEFVPSEFDWRIGVLEGRPLYACRYYMARGHWQIVSTGASRRRRYGQVEPVPIESVPAEAVDVALRATKPIGEGLYGVDVKEVDGRFLVIEVNDNPNVDAGYEDAVLGDRLYLTIMEWFKTRLDARGAGNAGRG